MAANACDTDTAGSNVMPAGASGRFPFAGTRQKPAREAANISRCACAPVKKDRCATDAPARSARSKIRTEPSVSEGRATPPVSQICASVNGPRFSKKRGSAILFLRRGRRRSVQVDLEGRHLLVQPVDSVAGDVKAASRGEHD